MSLLHLRYGDASWNGLENLMHISTMRQSTINKTRAGFYDTWTERIIGSRNREVHSGSGILNSNQQSSCHTDELQYEMQSIDRQDYCQNQLKYSKQVQAKDQDFNSCKSNIPGMDRNIILQKLAAVKRKASDCDIHLNLSLGLGPIRDGYREGLEDEDDHLSLSLCLPSSFKMRRSTEDTSTENVSGVSTLDLTL